MENKELFGELFKTIPLHSEEQLDLLLQTLSKEDAIQILIHAVKFGFNEHIYTLGECEVISKSIRVLKNID